LNEKQENLYQNSKTILAFAAIGLVLVMGYPSNIDIPDIL